MLSVVIRSGQKLLFSGSQNEKCQFVQVSYKTFICISDHLSLPVVTQSPLVCKSGTKSRNSIRFLVKLEHIGRARCCRHRCPSAPLCVTTKVMFVDGGKQFSILSEDLNTTLSLHLHISLSVLQNRMWILVSCLWHCFPQFTYFRVFFF